MNILHGWNAENRSFYRNLFHVRRWYHECIIRTCYDPDLQLHLACTPLAQFATMSQEKDVA